MRCQGVKLADAELAVACTLRSLRDLDLSGNAITAVPPAVARLTALTRLCLGDNLIGELPPQIGKLQVTSAAGRFGCVCKGVCGVRSGIGDCGRRAVSHERRTTGRPHTLLPSPCCPLAP